MGAEISNGKVDKLAGVVVEIVGGNVISYTTDLKSDTQGWALGSVGAWLEAIVDLEVNRLELGGDGRLARCLVEGLHAGLFLALPSNTRTRYSAEH